MKVVKSKKLGEEIVVVRNELESFQLRGRVNGRAIYTQQEVDMLKGMDEATLKTVHEAKKIFEGAIVEIRKT